MYCKNCGAQINDGAAFCEKCGAKQMTTPVEYHKTGDNLKRHFNSSIKRVLIIGGVLIVVLVIISAVLNSQKRASYDADTISVTQKTTQKTTTTTTQPEIFDYTPTEPLYSFSGNGDDVIAGISVDETVVVRITVSGKHYCSIEAHGASDSYDLSGWLVHDSAPYSGESLLFADDYTIEVKAQGAWTIEIFEMSFSTTDSFEGSGDTITPVFIASSDVYEISSVGNKGYFSVTGYNEFGDSEWLVHTSDAYSGKVYFKVKGSYAFFEIKGDRKFTIKPAE